MTSDTVTCPERMKELIVQYYEELSKLEDDKLIAMSYAASQAVTDRTQQTFVEMFNEVKANAKDRVTEWHGIISQFTDYELWDLSAALKRESDVRMDEYIKSCDQQWIVPCPEDVVQ